MSRRNHIATFEDLILILVSARVGAPIDPALRTLDPLDEATLKARQRIASGLAYALGEELGEPNWSLGMLSEVSDALVEDDNGLRVNLTQERVQELLGRAAMAVVETATWLQWRFEASAEPALVRGPQTGALRCQQRQHLALHKRVEATIQASLKGPLTTAELIELLGATKPTFMPPLRFRLDEQHHGEGAVGPVMKGDVDDNAGPAVLLEPQVPATDADVRRARFVDDVERLKAKALEEDRRRGVEAHQLPERRSVARQEGGGEGMFDRPAGE